MIGKIIIAAIIVLVSITNLTLYAQNKNKKDLPKLVVGIVVDQMRYDFLYRYYSKYSEGGFKRLMKEGYNCENTYINYVPTYTAPGHSSVYTGSTPALNGIAGNNWFDRTTGKVVYCTDDSTVIGVPTGGSKSKGQMSPAKMMTSTITDELKLASNYRSKVISVALKDRASILPGGHLADAAYWYDGKLESFITSTYYSEKLPEWLVKFNSRKLPDSLTALTWNTLLPIANYTESSPDNVNWEEGFKGKADPTFPYNLAELRKTNIDILTKTPYGNTITRLLAEATIKNENLGKGSLTDFLAVSFSSTDILGHSFGPNSIEVEDMYLRLDLELAEFLKYLDKTVGKGKYTLFLTADHGVANNPAYMTRDNRKNVPAGHQSEKKMEDVLKTFFATNYPDQTFFLSYINSQIYLDRNVLNNKKIDLNLLCSQLSNYLIKDSFFLSAINMHIENSNSVLPQINQIIAGTHPTRSGDIYLAFQPAWLEYGAKGSTHGMSYGYDSHIPLLFFGTNIPTFTDYNVVNITDIAPTLANLLHIQQPNGCIGKPIINLLQPND